MARFPIPYVCLKVGRACVLEAIVDKPRLWKVTVFGVAIYIRKPLALYGISAERQGVQPPRIQLYPPNWWHRLKGRAA